MRGGVGSREFRRYIEKTLVPVLRPGHIVLLDNLNAHKNKQVRELIEGAGASIQFLPPYSPDLNPIEAAWSKLKHFVRKGLPKSVKQLRAAIYAAFRKITPEDAAGWFRYCGYG